MSFDFTVYQAKKRMKKPADPTVEVKPNGRIIFNRQASELLESKPFCLLASDPINKAIGILPVENHDDNTFSIRNTAKGAYVGAKKFLKDTGLLPGSIVKQAPIKAGQYVAIKIG